MSIFDSVPLLAQDSILGLAAEFQLDARSNKINLSIGSYKTPEGHPFVLESVKAAERDLFEQSLNKEYLPIEGDAEFIKCGLELIFGKRLSVKQSNCYCAAQSVGGTGALRIGSEFLAKFSNRTIFLSEPSWINHKQVFEKAGLKTASYFYLDPKTHLLDYFGMKKSILNMPPSSIILLQANCHNPTGNDPSIEQWKELAHLIRKQQLIPFFDVAYHGFGRSLEEDVQVIRYFAQEIEEMLIAYSFSKNFGLYGERVGLLVVTCPNSQASLKAESQIKNLIRANYSNPPLHGSRIVSTILKSSKLTSEWKEELNHMRQRVNDMRQTLVSALFVHTQNDKFSYINQQRGIFAFLNFRSDQVEYLKEKKAIYMSTNGRINLAGLNTSNLPSVVEGIASAAQLDSRKT